MVCPDKRGVVTGEDAARTVQPPDEDTTTDAGFHLILYCTTLSSQAEKIVFLLLRNTRKRVLSGSRNPYNNCHVRAVESLRYLGRYGSITHSHPLSDLKAATASSRSR